MDGFKDLRIGENDSDTENIIYSPEIKTMPMVALRGKVVLPNVFTSFDVGRIKSLAAINAAAEKADELSAELMPAGMGGMM